MLNSLTLTHFSVPMGRCSASIATTFSTHHVTLRTLGQNYLSGSTIFSTHHPPFPYLEQNQPSDSTFYFYPSRSSSAPWVEPAPKRSHTTPLRTSNREPAPIKTHNCHRKPLLQPPVDRLTALIFLHATNKNGTLEAQQARSIALLSFVPGIHYEFSNSA